VQFSGSAEALYAAGAVFGLVVFLGSPVAAPAASSSSV